MARKEAFYELINVTGEPGGNSIGVFAEDKAPFGAHYPSEKSTPAAPVQKTLRVGTKIVTLDPDLVLTVQEKAAGTALWDSADGKNDFNERGFRKAYLFDPVADANGFHGREIVVGQGGGWVDCENHLRRFWLDANGNVVYVKPGTEPTPETPPGEEPGEEPGDVVVGQEMAFQIMSISWDKELGMVAHVKRLADG